MAGVSLFPIGLSLVVATWAMALAAPGGLAVAWAQARPHRARVLVDALVLLPLVLPPSVVGFVLLVLFGAEGPVGRVLGAGGFRLVFTPQAAVLASALVALPIVVKTVQPALESVPRELIDVARSLGLSPTAVLLRVVLPHAWRGVVAAFVLGYARAMGEFGATLMFAGNVPGYTNTMPIEIFTAWQAGDDRRALVYVLVLSALSLGVVAAASRLSPAPEPR